MPKTEEMGLTLFKAADLIDPARETLINAVYTAKMVKNKAGDVVGYTVKSTKPDEVRKQLGLPATKEGREAVAIEIRKRQDEQWAETKSWLINNLDLTLVGFQQRTNAKGLRGTVIKLIEAERPNDVNALIAKIERLTGRKYVAGEEIKPAVDVPEVKPLVALNPPTETKVEVETKPEVTPEEQDTADADAKAAAAELEQEENERLAREAVEA